MMKSSYRNAIIIVIIDIDRIVMLLIILNAIVFSFFVCKCQSDLRENQRDHDDIYC